MADSRFTDFWSKMGVKSPNFSMDWNAQVARMRKSFIRAAQSIETDVPEMAHVEDVQMSGDAAHIKARAYTPLAAGVSPGPGLVYFHGGGFVLGDLDTFDTICRRLAAASRCRVLSVDYRLAPEHKFPAPVIDAGLAYAWAVAEAGAWGVDPKRLAVGGDSAGANLAINITRLVEGSELPDPLFQLLVYPLTQFVDIRDKGIRLQEGPFFSPALFEFFRAAYLPEGQDPMDPRISPLFIEDFTGLPSAHVVTAGWDPLRDEGRAYVSKLAAAGVTVTHKDYPGQPHGFFNTTPVSIPARDAIADAGKIVGTALGALEAAD